MRARLAAERGSALVTALLVTMLFMMLGLTTMSLVDTQQRESGRSRCASPPSRSPREC